MAAGSDHITESGSSAVHPLGPAGHPTAAATSHPTPHHTDNYSSVIKYRKENTQINTSTVIGQTK